ncbi:3-hydroxyacyl-ACP dehydratase FabZ [Candidatus Sumerlaeota bacterium]|nr:3-hydroxyacyl-ACP dehydratase FabZ [Candidatus Sumerlaeota bacterium]
MGETENAGGTAVAEQTTRLNIEQIEALIPHRYPFLLVDRVLEMEPPNRIRALKSVSANEPFFQGHFPGHKIMPGVLIIEALAQAAAIMSLALPDKRGWLVYLAGVDNAKFRRPVVPGDALMLEVELVRMRGPFGTVTGQALVDGELAAAAEIKFAFQRPLED